MVEAAQGEVWWAELPEPVGSGPGLRRPVVVVQGNSLTGAGSRPWCASR